MDGFSSDQWNNIDGMVYFFLFDGTEQSCWAYLCTFQPGAQYDLWHFWVGDLQRLAGNIDCQRPILQTDKYFSFTSGQLISTGDFHRYPNREYLAV